MMGDLTKDFSRKEFACKDGCGYNAIDLMLVERLQAIRNAINESIHIRSGCRCPAHNANEKGKPNSAHLRGLAADIYIPDSGYRYRFLKQAFKIFSRIEIPDGSWVHVDLDDSLPQNICITS